MSNEVNNPNLQRIYMFLSSFESQGGWVSHADQDGDNYIMHCEFYDFITKKWDGENTPSPDLINKFWNSFDTNKDVGEIKGTDLRNLNALDKTEMKSLEAQLEKYVAFDTFMGQGGPVENEKLALKSKGIITDNEILSKWKGAIRDILAVTFGELINNNPNMSDEEIYEKLNTQFNEIKTGITAEYITLEQTKKAQNTILKGLDYDINNDDVLMGLINNYIQQYLSQNGDNIDLAELKKGIINIINQYLEKAGIDKKLPGGDDTIGKDDIDNIDNLGFDDDYTNNLQIAKLIAEQKAIIKQKVDEILKANNITDTKHDYYADATTLVTNYINEIKDGMSFDELKAEIAKFDYKTPIEKLIEFDEGHDDLTKDSELYDEVKTEFDEIFADYLADNDKFLAAYEQIIADARSEYINSGFDKDMDEYIIEQIKKRFPELYPDGLDSKDEVATLNSIYNNFVKSADALDAKAAAERILDGAIKYCDALAEKDPMFNIAFKTVFGSTDYASVLKSASTSEIKKYMEKLTTEALSLDLTNPLDSIQSSYTVMQGDESKIELPSNTYGATFEASGCLKYDSGTGKITIDTTNPGNFSGTVSMLLDGIVIGTKTINVTVQKGISVEKAVKNVKNWGGMTSSHLVSCVYSDNNEITSSAFQNLYNNNVVVSLLCDESTYTFNDTVKERFRQLCNIIKAALLTSGLDESTLNIATQNVFEKYCQSVKYKDIDPEVDNDDWVGLRKYASDLTNNDTNDEYSHCIFNVENYNSGAWDESIFAVSFRDLVDDIIAEYNRLLNEA